MLEIKNRFITPDDILAYFGVDLRAELPNNQAESLIMRIEDRVEALLQTCFFRRINFENMSDSQKTFFRKGLLEQTMYIFKSGDMMLDSDRAFEAKDIPPVVQSYFILCGLWCRHI